MTFGLSPAGLCITHDPERLALLKAARTKGGDRSRRPGRSIRVVGEAETPGALETFDDVVRWASWAAQAVATGAIDARTAREVSCALNAMRGALNVRDHEREVRALRAALRKTESKDT